MTEMIEHGRTERVCQSQGSMTELREHFRTERESEPREYDRTERALQNTQRECVRAKVL